MQVDCLAQSEESTSSILSTVNSESSSVEQPQSPHQIFQKAIESMNAEEFKVAEVLFLAVIEMQPDFAQAYHNLGVVYYRTEKMDKAIEYLEKAIQLNQREPSAFYLLGMALTKVGKIKEAKEAYQKAIELNPDMAEVHHNLGLLYYQTQEWEKAIQELKTALQLSPTSGNSLFALGLAYIGDGKPENAIELITTLRSLNNEQKAFALEKLLRKLQKSETPPELEKSPKKSKSPVSSKDAKEPKGKEEKGKGTVSITGDAQFTLKGGKNKKK